MKSQKDFFNEKAEIWDEICIHDIVKVKTILDMLDIEKGASVLDVGTGTGVLVPELSSRVGEAGSILAVDVSDKMIEVCERKHKYKNAQFKCVDALVLKENNYQYITCYSMFPHFQDKKEALTILAQKLSEKGKLIICHSQSRDAINSLHQTAGEEVKEDRLPTIETLEKYFSEAGLKTVHTVDNDEMFVIIGEKTNQ